MGMHTAAVLSPTRAHYTISPFPESGFSVVKASWNLYNQKVCPSRVVQWKYMRTDRISLFTPIIQRFPVLQPILCINTFFQFFTFLLKSGSRRRFSLLFFHVIELFKVV